MEAEIVSMLSEKQLHYLKYLTIIWSIHSHTIFAGSILQIEPKRLDSGYKPEPAVEKNCIIKVLDYNQGETIQNGNK